MFLGNASAAAMDRVSRFMTLSFTAGDAGSIRDAAGTSAEERVKSRNSSSAILASSKLTMGLFVSHVHRRLSNSSPRFATS